MADSGASMQGMYDKFADRLRMITDDMAVLGQVEALYKCIDHKRTDGESQKRIKSCLNIKHKTTGNSDQKIGKKQGSANIKAGILP